MLLMSSRTQHRGSWDSSPGREGEGRPQQRPGGCWDGDGALSSGVSHPLMEPLTRQARVRCTRPGLDPATLGGGRRRTISALSEPQASWAPRGTSLLAWAPGSALEHQGSGTLGPGDQEGPGVSGSKGFWALPSH